MTNRPNPVNPRFRLEKRTKTKIKVFFFLTCLQGKKALIFLISDESSKASVSSTALHSVLARTSQSITTSLREIIPQKLTTYIYSKICVSLVLTR